MRLRVLVAGSRDWHHHDSVVDDLTMLLHHEGVEVLTVVHGGDTEGVDQAAREFCAAWRSWTPFLGRDVVEEPHEAAWITHGTVAGAMRDREMVALGADVCLAYPLGRPSPVIELAAEAGIPVWSR